jgi:hypothetical protein
VRANPRASMMAMRCASFCASRPLPCATPAGVCGQFKYYRELRFK